MPQLDTGKKEFCCFNRRYSFSSAKLLLLYTLLDVLRGLDISSPIIQRKRRSRTTGALSITGLAGRKVILRVESTQSPNIPAFSPTNFRIDGELSWLRFEVFNRAETQHSFWCWLIQMVCQSDSTPCPTEVSLQLQKGERRVMLSHTTTQEHKESKSQVPQEVLPSSGHEQDASDSYYTAFFSYWVFFSLIFAVASCWGVSSTLPHNQLHISSNTIHL